MSQYKYKKPDPSDEKQKQRPKSKKYKLKQQDQQDSNYQKHNQESETLPNTSRSNVGSEVAPFFGVVSSKNQEPQEPHSPNFVKKLSQNFKQMRVRARNMGFNNKLQQINSYVENNYSSVLETKNSLNSNQSSNSNQNQLRVENTTLDFTSKGKKKIENIEENKSFNNLNTDATFEVNIPGLHSRKNIQQDKQALSTKSSKGNQNSKKQQEEIKNPTSEDTSPLQRRNKKSYTISKTLIKAAIGQQMEKSMNQQNSIASPLSPSENHRLKSGILSNILTPLQSPLKSPLTNQSPNKVHAGSKSLGYIAENTSNKEDSEDDELPNDPANNLGDFVKFQKAKLLNDLVEKQGKNLSSIDQEIVQRQQSIFQKSQLDLQLQLMSIDKRITKATRHIRDILYQRTCRFDLIGG